jgi:hypothetical protein
MQPKLMRLQSLPKRFNWKTVNTTNGHLRIDRKLLLVNAANADSIEIKEEDE